MKGELFLFLPLCMFFLSCSALGVSGLVALVSPLPPRSVCLMLSDWREGLGDGSILLPVGLVKKINKMSRNELSNQS